MAHGPVSDLLASLRHELLASATPEGWWEGRLSSSALATAVAIAALAAADHDANDGAIGSGLDWLQSSARPDGGWGDTPSSPANLSTTLLAWGALGSARIGTPTA